MTSCYRPRSWIWSCGFSRCCASRWWGSGCSSKNRPSRFGAIATATGISSIRFVHGGEADQDAIQTISRIFRIREATLVNGKVLIIDDARPDGTRSMTFESVEASLVVRAERGQADLHVSAGHAERQRPLHHFPWRDHQHRPAADVGDRRFCWFAGHPPIRWHTRSGQSQSSRGRRLFWAPPGSGSVAGRRQCTQSCSGCARCRGL